MLSEPNRRIRIADFSIADLEQFYAIRISLEVVATRATVPVLAPEDLAELEGLMAQMDQRACDLDRYRTPHAAFHVRFIVAAGPRITALLAQVFDHGEHYRRSSAALDPEGWYVRREEHRQILDTAGSQRPGVGCHAACHALRAHGGQHDLRPRSRPRTDPDPNRARSPATPRRC